MRFLLIVRAKLDLRSCCCSDRGGQIVTRNKKWNPLWGKRLGELTKMWHTQRKARANRVKLCKQTMRKLRATKNVLKVERCGSSLLTSNRKLNLEQNC